MFKIKTHIGFVENEKTGYETYYLQIGGQHDAVRFMDWLYKNSNDFSRMNRKYEEFKKFKKVLTKEAYHE